MSFRVYCAGKYIFIYMDGFIHDASHDSSIDGWALYAHWRATTYIIQWHHCFYLLMLPSSPPLSFNSIPALPMCYHLPSTSPAQLCGPQPLNVRLTSTTTSWPHPCNVSLWATHFTWGRCFILLHSSTVFNSAERSWPESVVRLPGVHTNIWSHLSHKTHLFRVHLDSA